MNKQTDKEHVTTHGRFSKSSYPLDGERHRHVDAPLEAEAPRLVMAVPFQGHANYSRHGAEDPQRVLP